MIDAPTWVGRIEKECKKGLADKIKSKMRRCSHENLDLGKHLKEFIDIVDRFWHILEGKYDLQLKNRMDIVKIPKDKRKEIAEEICTNIEEIRKCIKESGCPNLCKILEYMREKKIP